MYMLQISAMKLSVLKLRLPQYSKYFALQITINRNQLKQ